MPTIKILSHNIQGTDVKKNLEEIALVAKNAEVDVVAVQGCTSLNYEVLIREMKKIGLVCFRFADNFSKPEGELLFTRLETGEKKYISYRKTRQQRALSIYEIKTDVGGICVCTSKMETGDGSIPFKKAQLEELFSIFHNVNFIFAGDISTQEWQNVILPSGIFDAWREQGTARDEKTHGRDRPDRFLFGKEIECVSFRALEMENTTRRAILGEFRAFPTISQPS
jgi:hypothetical protein